ncbi:MAG: hypothetical protein J5527_14220 [Treponema sp.]|nr:hypothetical protein [Treponema sp.]
MKKRVSVLLFTALFLASTVFMACSNGTSGAAESNYSANSAGQGYVMGYVLDNRGSPVEGATVTLGTKQVKTNSGGEFVIENVAVNDLVAAGLTTATSKVSKTNFFLTATKKDKDGKDLYLPAKSAAIYVTYAEAESAASDAYITELNALVAEYSAILKAYADALKNGAASTDVTITGQTTDVVTTTTTSKTTDADGVFKVLADAIASLKDKINNREFTKDFYSDFAEFTMIPLDASFAGSVKLNLTAKTKNTTIISEKTYIPTSAPVVHATYKPTAANAANYHWDATVDETGRFKFEGLPSGVNVYFSIDSFIENVSGTDYVFSSESSELMIENSSAAGVFEVVATTPTATPSAVSMDTINGQKSAVFMLYAQNDKIWITDTSVKDSTGEKLLDTKAPITFKFNKPMIKVNIEKASATATTTGIKDIDDKNATLTLSTDKKTATFTPNDGNWTITGDVEFKITGEAEDGATTILNPTFKAYFDKDIWIGLDTADVKSFDDVDGLLALNAPIVLTFSKEMTDFVEVAISYEKTPANGNTAAVYENVSNIYTKEWSEDHKTLTIKPDTYWVIPKGNLLIASVTKAKAADGTETPKYWKTGVIETTSGNTTTQHGLAVYFNNYIDVIVADASTATQEAFTIKFSKELKAFDEKTDLTIQYIAGGTASSPSYAAYNYYDYTAVLGDWTEQVEKTVTAEDGTPSTTTDTVTHKNSMITVTAKESVFEKEGKYKIYFTNLEAFDGSTQIREKGNYKTLITSSAPYETEFAFDGFVLKPVSIDVIDTLPATAVESRAIEVVTTAQYLKFKFTKPISKATIKAGDSLTNAVKATNYIDSADPTIVYVSLVGVNAVEGDLVVSLANNVTAVDGDVISTEPTATDYEKWLGYEPKFRIYAALTLEGTSLIKAKETASGIITTTNKDKVKINYEVADPIAPCGDITFTFSEKPDTVDWTLYAYDKTTNGKIEAKLVDKGTVTATDKTVTIHSNKLLPNTDKADVADSKFGDLTRYFIDLSASKGGVSVFNTTNKYFPSQTAGTFEKDAIDTLIYKADASRATPATTLKCGTLEIKVKPIVLAKTNLIEGANKSEYKKIDALASGTNVTFEFDTDLTGYKVIYNLYGLKPENLEKATPVAADYVILTENAVVTPAAKVVTIPGTKLISKKAVGDLAYYFIELNIATAEDLTDEDTVKLYTTTSTKIGTKTNSFEADAKGLGIFENPPVSPATVTAHNNKGSFIVEVAEPDILEETILVKATPFSLSDTLYEALDGSKVEYAVPAKSEITFTLSDDVDLTGCTAKYELFDLAANDGTNDPQLISSGNATITGQTIKVQDNLMVSGNPKVTGKTFNVATSNTTGISTYYLKLEVAKADKTVIFSSDTKNWWTAANEKDKDRKAFETELAKLTTNGYFKISVAPLAVEGLNYVEEKKDSFDNSVLTTGKKTYTEKKLDPKAAVEITFNTEIPVGAKYSWAIKDSTSNTVEPIDKTATAIAVTTATKKISIQSNKMVAKTDKAQDYYIDLTIMNGEDKLFGTDNAYFGSVNDFEKDIKTKTLITTKSTTDDQLLKVTVAQTEIITKKVDNVESVTTKDDTDNFKKSYKSPIVIQFSHPVTGYKAVLYSTSKLYTDKTDPKSLTTLTEADPNTSTPATKYADFIKDSAEFIYASTATIADKVMTITPAGYYGLNKTINIAFFNDDGDYVKVPTDLSDYTTNPPTFDYRTYTTANVDADLTKEIVADANDLTVVTPTTKIGDNQNVVFSIPTDLSALSDKLATYKLYVKNAESTAYNEVTSTAGGYDSVTTNSLLGKDEYDEENNVIKGNYISRENNILGRADTSYISYGLAAQAFGIRKGGKVEVLLIKEQDSNITAYKATLADAFGTKNLTATDVTTDPVITITTTGAAATINSSSNKITITGVQSLDPNDTAHSGAVTNVITESEFAFKVNLSGEYLKRVNPTLSKKQTNQPATPADAKTSAATFTVNYDANAVDAIVQITKGQFFMGDQITIEILDTNDNKSTFVFTVE